MCLSNIFMEFIKFLQFAFKICQSPFSLTSFSLLTTQGQTVQKKQSEKRLGYTVGRLLLFQECIPERQCSGKCLCGNKGAGWHHFPHWPLSINTEPLVGDNKHCHWLPKSFTQSPNSLLLQQYCPSIKLVTAPVCQFPPPEDQHKTLPTPQLLTRKFCRASVLVQLAPSLISQADES